MAEYKLGVSPGVIVGGILVLLVLFVMLTATIFVVWRSRPTAVARAQRRRKSVAAADLGCASPPSKTPESPTIEKDEGDTDTESPELPGPILPRVSHSNASTLNVIISPSVPHLVKLGTGGGVELRVTPPSPVLIPGNGSVRFGGPPGAMGENESVWWFI